MDAALNNGLQDGIGLDAPDVAGGIASAPPAVTQTLAQGLSQPTPNSAPTDAPKRHGGLLTGLVGVLLDGLSAGVKAPMNEQGPSQAAATAMQMPQPRRQQMQAAKTAALQSQVQLAQMQVQIQQIKHMASTLNDQQRENLTDLQKSVVQKAVNDGGLDLLGETDSREAATSRVAELHAQHPDEALNYMALISKHDKDGNPVWGVYQLRGKNTLSADRHDVIKGDSELGVDDVSVDGRAGQSEEDYWKGFTQKTRDQIAKIDAAKAVKVQGMKGDTATEVQGQKGATAVKVAGIKATTSANPQDINTQAKMLVEGDLDPSQVSKRSGTQGQILSAANKYSQDKFGKPYDAAQQQSDYKFATNTQTQNTLKYLNSLTGNDNKSGNLGTLINMSDKITRTDFPALNDVAAWARLETGDPAIAQYHTAVTEVSDQVAKILQGGGSGAGTSDAKLKQAQDMFRQGFSKEQIRGVSSTLRELLANRKREMIGDNIYLKKQYGRSAAAADREDPFAAFGGKKR